MARNSVLQQALRAAQRTILVVEDDPSIADVLCTNLKIEGYHVVQATSLAEAERAVHEAKPLLILLDLNLPEGKGAGFELCRQIREEDPKLPILILTANTDEDTAVRGLGLGASDVLRKPFRRRELLALVKNRLESVVGQVQWGPFLVVPEQGKIFFSNTEIALTITEFIVLALLITARGEVVTRAELLRSIDPDVAIDGRTLTSYLSRIRSKLIKIGAAEAQITSSYGTGYRLVWNSGRVKA